MAKTTSLQKHACGSDEPIGAGDVRRRRGLNMWVEPLYRHELHIKSVLSFQVKVLSMDSGIKAGQNVK